jgi:hypothetical protein
MRLAVSGAPAAVKGRAVEPVNNVKNPQCTDERYPKKIISQNLSYTYSVYVTGKLWKCLHARLTRMRRLVTFGELGNVVDTTGKGSMHFVTSRIAIRYACPASFSNANMDVNLLHGKAFVAPQRQRNNFRCYATDF